MHELTIMKSDNGAHRPQFYYLGVYFLTDFAIVCNTGRVSVDSIFPFPPFNQTALKFVSEMPVWLHREICVHLEICFVTISIIELITDTERSFATICIDGKTVVIAHFPLIYWLRPWREYIGLKYA